MVVSRPFLYSIPAIPPPHFTHAQTNPNFWKQQENTTVNRSEVTPIATIDGASATAGRGGQQAPRMKLLAEFTQDHQILLHKYLNFFAQKKQRCI